MATERLPSNVLSCCWDLIRGKIFLLQFSTQLSNLKHRDWIGIHRFPQKTFLFVFKTAFIHTYLYVYFLWIPMPRIQQLFIQTRASFNPSFMCHNSPCLRVKLHRQAPEMQDDLISTFTPSCHALVSFSIGYFIYDALDMVIYHRWASLIKIYFTVLLMIYIEIDFCQRAVLWNKSHNILLQRNMIQCTVSKLHYCFVTKPQVDYLRSSNLYKSFPQSLT